MRSPFLSGTRLWVAIPLALFIMYGCDNQQIKPETRVIKLAGPVAYKILNDRMVVEGMVENTGEKKLEDITVIVSWYNQDKEYLSRAESKIGEKALLPGESCPYRLEQEFDPRMNNYSIGFYNKDNELISMYHLKYKRP